MKRFSVLKTVFLLLGTVIGAGFASGREVFMFFGSFNMGALFCILLCGVCFFLVCLMFLNVSDKAEFNCFLKSKIGAVFNFIMIFIMLISVSALTAAITTSINVYVSFASLCICLFVVFRGIEWLKGVNFVLVPIIVATLMIVSIKSSLSGVFISLTKPLVYNAFLYVGMNIFLASEVLVDASKSLTKNEKFWSAIISSILFVTILIVLTVGFSFGGINSSVEMPILYMSKKMSGIFSKIYLFVLWCGIFTTLISIVYSMKKKLESTFSFKGLTTVIFCMVAFCLSFFGFGKIVSIFYPLEGVIGAIYCAFIFIFVFVMRSHAQKSSKIKAWK